MRCRAMVLIGISGVLWACGGDGTTIVGESEGERDAARLVADDHTAGNDGTEEAPSRVECRRTGTSEFPVPVGQRAKGVYRCAAKYPDGITEDCEVDAGRDEVGCVPSIPGVPTGGKNDRERRYR